MPYVSDAQRKFAHTDTAKKEGFPTEEFDAASKGHAGLPEHASKKAHPTKAKIMKKHMKKAHREWNDHPDNPMNSMRM